MLVGIALLIQNKLISIKIHSNHSPHLHLSETLLSKNESNVSFVNIVSCVFINLVWLLVYFDLTNMLTNIGVTHEILENNIIAVLFNYITDFNKHANIWLTAVYRLKFIDSDGLKFDVLKIQTKLTLFTIYMNLSHKQINWNLIKSAYYQWPTIFVWRYCIGWVCTIYVVNVTNVQLKLMLSQVCAQILL